jgi:hypothetical protein
VKNSAVSPRLPYGFYFSQIRKHHLAVKKSGAEALLADLTAPFEDEQKTGANSSIAPHHYLRRLVDTVPGLYSIKRSAPVPISIDGANAIAVVTNVEIELDEVTRTFADVGAQGVTQSEEDKNLANTIKGASSDSLKRALLAAGVNLDTYETGDYEEETAAKPARASKRATKAVEEEPEDDEPEEKPARRTTKPAAKPARGGSYDGTEDIGFGANKDVAWKDIHGGWLAYCEGQFDDGPNLKKVIREIERREAEGTASTNALHSSSAYR